MRDRETMLAPNPSSPPMRQLRQLAHSLSELFGVLALSQTNQRRNGYGVPAAASAKIAFSDRMVVSMVGDGGFMITGQEIASAFRHRVARIILVFNNQMYGTIRMHQERACPWRVLGTALTTPISPNTLRRPAATARSSHEQLNSYGPSTER
jgi:hypothetical protein